MTRSAECRCDSNFTCGHCLRNAPPWLWTSRTMAEVIADEHREWLKKQAARPAIDNRPYSPCDHAMLFDWGYRECPNCGEKLVDDVVRRASDGR